METKYNTAGWAQWGAFEVIAPLAKHLEGGFLVLSGELCGSCLISLSLGYILTNSHINSNSNSGLCEKSRTVVTFFCFY